ncbi:MAG: diadenylate cyclase [bacterium]|jgi:diadenylate cyclase
MIQEFFLNFYWHDFIDIFILTVILYRLILMIQGTRTIQMVLGMTIVIASYLLSGYLKLGGVNWLLTNLFNSFVVVIIVIFQTDFRNALAQMGTKTFFQKQNNQASNSLINKVVDVCELLSQSKTGVLIVFEKDVGLRNYANSGTRLDAELSPPLLASIFDKHVPLHDGAVIVDRQSRIHAAGCILPLTARLDISQKFGTRHRAALGITEVTDAVVVVVSEETGRITLVYKGEYFVNQIGFSIQDKLKELLPHLN